MLTVPVPVPALVDSLTRMHNNGGGVLVTSHDGMPYIIPHSHVWLVRPGYQPHVLSMHDRMQAGDDEDENRCCTLAFPAKMKVKLHGG